MDLPTRRVMSLDALEALAGGELGVSSWFDMPQSRIDAFADVTLDHQFIHVDPLRAAAETPFGGTIAHGFLTLSMMSAMVYEVVPEIDGTASALNYGFDKIRFLTPVRAGGRIRGRFVLAGLTRRSDKEVLMRYAVTVESDGSDKPALIADWLGLVILT